MNSMPGKYPPAEPGASGGEHVIDWAARLAERVVGDTPQAHVLTTSREALRAEGEHIHPLYALDCPPEEEDLTAVEALKYPAVQLFMERAAASGHGAVSRDSDAPWSSDHRVNAVRQGGSSQFSVVFKRITGISPRDYRLSL
jgi:hypothetical protein